MNKILLLAMMLLGLTSCNKEQVEPENTITYQVDCIACHFKYEDEHWNRDNERYDAKSQYINVYNSAKVTFTHKDLKEIKFSVHQSVMMLRTQIVFIKIIKKGKVIFNEKVELGWMGHYDREFNIKL